MRNVKKKRLNEKKTNFPLHTKRQARDREISTDRLLFVGVTRVLGDELLVVIINQSDGPDSFLGSVVSGPCHQHEVSERVVTFADQFHCKQ